MPAEKKEIEEAKKEGIKFLFQNNIVEIKRRQKSSKIRTNKNKISSKEEETRLVPINIEGSNYEINTDYVCNGTRKSSFLRSVRIRINIK